MRIKLRGMASPALVRKLRDSGIAQIIGDFQNDLFFDASWPDPSLAEFLKAAAGCGSFDLNPWMEFSRADIERAAFFRLRPRKVVEDSSADFETMRARIDEQPWIGSDPKRRFRLPESVHLSKVSLSSDQLAGVGQWTAEYLVPGAVRKLIEEAGLTGVSFRPVHNTRTGGSFDDVFHLYSTSVLGDRLLDVASPELSPASPDEQGYDAMGCFCYDTATLAEARDFNRSGERNVSFEFPEWIVRANVRERYARWRLKGWAFEPVLERGTDAYDDYDELWTSFRELLGSCGAHTVRSRRFHGR